MFVYCVNSYYLSDVLHSKHQHNIMWFIAYGACGGRHDDSVTLAAHARRGLKTVQT